MLTPKPIENSDLILCQKHNSNIILFSLVKEETLEDQFLCIDCIKEKSIIQSSLPWDDVKIIIQDRQQKRQNQFQNQLTQLIELIEFMKNIIHQIQTQINQGFETIGETITCWLNDIHQQRNEEFTYSLFEELELMINQSQPFSFNSSEGKKLSNLEKLNHFFTKKLQDQFQFIKPINPLQQLEEVIIKISSITKVDYFQNLQYELKQFQSKKSSSIKCICPEHHALITMINLSNDRTKEKRTECNHCLTPNSIPILQFEELWHNYQSKLVESNIDKRHILEINIINIKKEIAQMRQRMDKQIYTIHTGLDTYLKVYIQHTQRQSLTTHQINSIQLQDMVSELSQFTNNNIRNQDNENNTKFMQLIFQMFSECKRSLHIILDESQQHLIGMLEGRQNQKSLNKKQQFDWQLLDQVKQQENCYSIAFNNEDTIMVAGCQEIIKIWQIENGKLVKSSNSLLGHEDSVYCLIFSKKMNWFASGSKDCTIICWKEASKNNWSGQKVQQRHIKPITCIVLNKHEDELISCSSDNSIKVWKVNCLKNELKYDYTLSKHTDSVYCISLNESNTYLASCSFDKQIIIWGKKVLPSKWEFINSIKTSADDFGCRLCFINNDMIAWQQHTKGWIHFFLNEQGAFTEKSELKIQLFQSGRDDFLFPSIFNTQRQLLINKYKQFVYMLKLQPDGGLKIVSLPIDCENSDNFGALSNNGEILVIWSKGTYLFKVYKLNYD